MRRDPFQAIADPVRREIIELLSREPLTIMQVVDKFEMTRPGVVKHLKILRDCGIIDIKRKGREQVCSIQTKSLVPAFMWIEKFHMEWTHRVNSFERYIHELHHLNTAEQKHKPKIKPKSHGKRKPR
ncbi:MAG TPA: metalloregulator ArsR/SmtB family transcription factor [Flavobacteriales bacterium]|nr:metalloregulator ArsR/SmtB family transcription factor [Flavobacteriales bacterium]